MKAADLKIYDLITIKNHTKAYWVVDIICSVIVLACDERFTNCKTISFAMSDLDDKFKFDKCGYVKPPFFHKYVDYIPFELKVKYIYEKEETIDLIEKWVKGL